MNKFWAFLSKQRVPAEQMPIKNLISETRLLLLYSVFYVLLAIGIAQLILVYPLPLMGAVDFIQDFWYAVIFKFIFLLAVPSWIYFRKWDYTYKSLLLGLQPTFSTWIKGFFLVAFGFFLNVGHLTQISENLPTFPDNPVRMSFAVLLPFFIAGLPEELFFRGFLQTRLEKIWNPTLAILVSGILFTAWHLPSRFFLAHGAEGQAGDLGSILVGTGIPVFIVSLFFGWHWTRYRNLPLLILIHWAIDILPSVSSFYQILR